MHILFRRLCAIASHGIAWHGMAWHSIRETSGYLDLRTGKGREIANGGVGGIGRDVCIKEKHVSRDINMIVTCGECGIGGR